MAHKLSAAAMAVDRGRVYLCGLYAALRGKEVKGKVKFTRWLRRNLNRWVRYFESGAPRMRLLVPVPNQPQKFCPHTDASTSWGYGGYFIKMVEGKTVRYYIRASGLIRRRSSSTRRKV